MSIDLIIILLVTHFVGDFICQSDWMALNKSKDWWALTVHVGVYTLVLSAALVFLDVSASPEVSFFIWGNALAHFIQDAITSRINSRLWFIDTYPRPPQPMGGTYSAYPLFARFTETRHWFFVGIGGDQLLHYITLFVTAKYLLT